MRRSNLWSRLVGVEDAHVVAVEPRAHGVYFKVRLLRRTRGRCAFCLRPCPRYDRGDGLRTWRTLPVGLNPAFIELDGARVRCPEHGVHGEHVPWARPGSHFSRLFEDTVAWLTARTDKSAIGAFFGIVWRTVGRIVERVVTEARSRRDPLDGVTRIGIDEVAYRRGHRFLTVVVDHDTGNLIYAAEGKGKASLEPFFDLLGPVRCKAIKLVSLDAGAAYQSVVRHRCPHAKRCLDPFHVVKWATAAIETIRRRVWNEARTAKRIEVAKAVKGARYAVLKNPDTLTPDQQFALEELKLLNAPLYEGYLMKEQLREVFSRAGDPGKRLLDKWLRWVDRENQPEFKAVAATVRENIAGIRAVLAHRLTNARVESLNTRMQLLSRIAFGFHSASALIALAMLKLGGFCPDLPKLGAHGPSR